MAAFDFPNSPNTNDTYTANGVTFTWNGTKWMRTSPSVGAQGSIGSTGAQGATGSGGSTGAQGATGTTGTVFTSGTRMLFQQSTAPTGWTKDSTRNNRALRIVNGTVGDGGGNGFAEVLTSTVTTGGGIVQNHTLTVAQMPAHQHDTSVTNSNLFPSFGGVTIGFGGPGQYPATTFTMSNTGGGQAHNHGLTQPSFNLNVLYTDVIIAQKN